MSRGYAEGPATEERFAALEQRSKFRSPVAQRFAVYGATQERPERHFLGWRDEIDPDELFASGRAWGLSVVQRPA